MLGTIVKTTNFVIKQIILSSRIMTKYGFLTFFLCQLIGNAYAQKIPIPHEKNKPSNTQIAPIANERNPATSVGQAAQPQAAEATAVSPTPETQPITEDQQTPAAGDEKPPVTVADMLDSCKSYTASTFNTRSTAVRRSTCNAYFFGVGSTLLMLNDKIKDSDICLPQLISTEKMVKAFIKWTSRNSKYMQMHATTAVMSSLKEAYPCNIVSPAPQIKESAR